MEIQAAAVTGPPATRPATARASAMTKSPAPERTRKAPKITKRNTVVEEIRAMFPKSPSSL